TLLGDAAHPMLQYLAQGACMATEDAVCLAEACAQLPANPATAFQNYVQQRYLRTARVQIMARVYGDFYHARGPAAELRDQMLRNISFAAVCAAMLALPAVDATAAHRGGHFVGGRVGHVGLGVRHVGPGWAVRRFGVWHRPFFRRRVFVGGAIWPAYGYSCWR